MIISSKNLATFLIISVISVMGKLPATSYVRLVDIWLIFGQLVPFIEEGLIAISKSKCYKPFNLSRLFFSPL